MLRGQVDRPILSDAILDPLLPSRTAAWTRLRVSYPRPGSLGLLTGEPGSGKTWLLDRLSAVASAEATRGPRWRIVDAAPDLDATGLLAAIASALGCPVQDRDSTGTLARSIARLLAEDHRDGRRSALAIDEAHLLALDALEAARLLANRVAAPDGFIAIVLAGQTTLGHRLECRRLAAVKARIVDPTHLPPIDADEAATLLADRIDSDLNVRLIERIHRDSGGNPARLLQIAESVLNRDGRASSRPQVEPTPPRPIVPELAEAPAEPTTRHSRGILPARPPIRLEEGLIEVGWESLDDHQEFDRIGSDQRPSLARTLDAQAPDVLIPGDYPIDDPLAVLQAHRERCLNQELVESDVAASPDDLEGEENLDSIRPVYRRPDPAEPFGPHEQLIARLREPIGEVCSQPQG